jgi:nitrate reductase NapD
METFAASQSVRPAPLHVPAHHRPAVNLSGIVVTAADGRLDEVVAGLRAQEGVEVRQTDPATGRAVVVQEAATVEDEVAGLARIKALPGIVAAEMVYHYFAEDPALAGASAAPPHTSEEPS